MGYTFGMKTAISLPDALFEEADATARRLGISRSRLFAEAVARYLAEQRAAGVTERLDVVYGRSSSRLDPLIEQLQHVSVFDGDW